MRSSADLAKLAGRQHGVVSHQQLLHLGLSKSAIGRASAAARLVRLHRGVYAVGHAGVTRQGRCLAAVLACGKGAVLSHDAAGWLWGVLPECPAIVDVTVGTRGHRRSGIRLHHAPALSAAACAVRERIPVTALGRTLLDLASASSIKRTERAVERAERLGLLDLIEVDAVLDRTAGTPGGRRLRHVLDLYRDPAFFRVRSERLLLALVRKAGLPRPAMNTFVAGHEIDAYWAPERFAVELDGYETHRTRAAFERDPLRQEELKLAGIDSVRFTARRIEREPGRVAERLSLLLAQRRRDLEHR